MNRVIELKQKRAAVGEQAKLLNKKAQDEKRNLTAEEQTQFDTLFDEMQGYTRQISNIEREAQVDSAIDEVRSQRRAAGGPDAEQSNVAFKRFLQFGAQSLSPEQRGFLEPGMQNSPNFRMAPEHRSVQSELTGAAGGYLVPIGFLAEVQTALKFYTGFFDAGAYVLNTDSGNDMQIPTSNDTSNMAIELGESSPVSQVAVPFGQVVMHAFKYTSNLIIIPLELLQDSAVDIQAYIVRLLGIRFGRRLNQRFTAGTGTGQPRGVLLDAPTGKTTAGGQTTTLIYDDLVDLKYSVNRAYRAQAKWMMNDGTLKGVLKLKDTAGRPLILDYIAGIQDGEPQQLLGQQIINNDDMPDLGASATPVAYGAWNNYWIRHINMMLMMRLVERFADLGQVAFLGFQRWDGRLIDAGTNPIKVIANAGS